MRFCHFFPLVTCLVTGAVAASNTPLSSLKEVKQVSCACSWCFGCSWSCWLPQEAVPAHLSTVGVCNSRAVAAGQPHGWMGQVLLALEELQQSDRKGDGQRAQLQDLPMWVPYQMPMVTKKLVKTIHGSRSMSVLNGFTGNRSYLVVKSHLS